MKIERIIGREIYDARGLPTVECELILEDGTSVTSSVPSGTSVGQHECVELRDQQQRLHGFGVSQAVENIHQKIAPTLVGKEPESVAMDLAMIELDGTHDKRILGANAMLAVSMSIFRAQALINQMQPYELIAYLCQSESVTLPLPMINVINGGAHAQNALCIQEMLIIPAGLSSFAQAMEATATFALLLKEEIIRRNYPLIYGMEGGIATTFSDEKEALDILMETIARAQLETSARFVISLDIAASQLYNKENHCYQVGSKMLTRADMISWYQQLLNQYPIYSIEDALYEDDWEGWQELYKALGNSVLIVSDDLTVTNPERISQMAQLQAAHAVVIKPNQIGTITQTLQSIMLCKQYDKAIVISGRSGETNDPFIADLAVGSSASHLKAGGFTRGERLAKYNHILRIEDFLMLSLLGS